MKKNKNLVFIILGILSYFIALISYYWYELFGYDYIFWTEEVLPVTLWFACCLPILKAEEFRKFWWVLPSGLITLIPLLTTLFIFLCWSISGFAP